MARSLPFQTHFIKLSVKEISSINILSRLRYIMSIIKILISFSCALFRKEDNLRG